MGIQLIKQSQDDGGDEISWKISPMTERLKSLAEKKLPEAIKFSWDAARTGVPSIHSCSQKQVFLKKSSSSLCVLLLLLLFYFKQIHVCIYIHTYIKAKSCSFSRFFQ